MTTITQARSRRQSQTLITALANHWPEQYGGPGWNAVQKFIFDNECALGAAPRTVPFGVNMLGPVLIKYGNEAQKRYWLPRIIFRGAGP